MYTFIKAIQKMAIRIIHPCAYDIPYTNAVLADLPTMSNQRDQLARKLSTILLTQPSSPSSGPSLCNSVTSSFKISL